MSKQYCINENELVKILEKAFESGWYGCLELKTETVKNLIEECKIFEKLKYNVNTKINYSIDGNTITVGNLSDDSNFEQNLILNSSNNYSRNYPSMILFGENVSELANDL